MNNKSLMIVSLILFFSVNANEKKLDSLVIEKKALVIQKMIERHRHIVVGVTACAFLQQLPALLTGLGSLCNISFGKQEPAIKESEKLSFFQAMGRGFGQTFFTQDGWQNSWTLIAGWVATHVIMQNVLLKYSHPDSLKWYIRTHIPYNKTLIIMKKIIKDLQSDDIEINEKKRKHVLLVDFCEQLVGYAEDMCAYMEYKGDTLQEDKQKISAHNCARYLFNYHNDILESISNELSNTSPQYAVIATIIDSYQAELSYNRKIFSVIEGESEYDEKLLVRQ